MVSPLPTFCSASSRLPGATVTPSLRRLSALVTVRVAACETGARKASASARHEFFKITMAGLIECVIGGYRNELPKQALYRRDSLPESFAKEKRSATVAVAPVGVPPTEPKRYIDHRALNPFSPS